jgi:hypothetical protein
MEELSTLLAVGTRILYIRSCNRSDPLLIQLMDTWQEILQTLISIETTISALIMIVFIQLLCQIANARNTQVVARSTHTPKQPQREPSLIGRIWRRLRPSKRLPEGDTKELTEK